MKGINIIIYIWCVPRSSEVQFLQSHLEKQMGCLVPLGLQSQWLWLDCWFNLQIPHHCGFEPPSDHMCSKPSFSLLLQELIRCFTPNTSVSPPSRLASLKMNEIFFKAYEKQEKENENGEHKIKALVGWHKMLELLWLESTRIWHRLLVAVDFLLTPEYSILDKDRKSHSQKKWTAKMKI